MRLEDVPTPALVVDVPAMEENIATMARFFAQGPCRLRPHFKAHKTPEIARRQLAAGGCVGLTCQTVGEAEVIAAHALTTDVLISNQPIGPGKAERVARLAREVDVKVAVDSPRGVEELATAARAQGVEIGVLVEVNVGLPRCGMPPGEPALALARLVASTPGLRLRGLMGYEGHVVLNPDRQAREEGARKAMAQLLETVRLLRDDGLPCEIVSAGGTGTYDITGRLEGITEIQAGSYVLMDTAYARLGLPFRLALYVLGTVISRPSPFLLVADVGLKACATDHGNPQVADVEGAQVLFLSDEHATVAVPQHCPLQVGDRIRFWPSHIDPTVNLHDRLYAAVGEEVVGVWPVAARGYPEQRA